MYKAILSGLLETNRNISDVRGHCSAEACKWNDYTTLAVCGSVEEVAGEVRNVSGSRGGAIPRFSISGASWKPPMQRLTVQDTFWMAAPFREPANVTDGRLPPVSEIFVAYYPPCNSHNKTRAVEDPDQWATGVNDAANWKAYKGTLSLCLQTLSSTYNNTMQTRVVNTQNELKFRPHNPMKDRGVPLCLSESNQGDEFCVGDGDLEQWTSALARSLEGAASIERSGSDNYYTGQWVPSMVGDILGPTPADCNPNLDEVYGLQGFTQRIDNIATAMSNALRTGNSTSPLSVVRGSEWKSEQYIAVDFMWIIPPGVVYLAITLFLFATIFKSRNMEVPLWKTSPLVLPHLTERNNGMQSLNQVEKESQRTRVKLQYTGENWHLQEVTGMHR
jgi:hypothetical protein